MFNSRVVLDYIGLDSCNTMRPDYADPVVPIINEIKVTHFQQERRWQTHPFVVSLVYMHPTFRRMGMPRQEGAIEVSMAVRAADDFGYLYRANSSVPLRAQL